MYGRAGQSAQIMMQGKLSSHLSLCSIAVRAGPRVGHMDRLSAGEASPYQPLSARMEIEDLEDCPMASCCIGQNEASTCARFGRGGYIPDIQLPRKKLLSTPWLLSPGFSAQGTEDILRSPGEQPEL